MTILVTLIVMPSVCRLYVCVLINSVLLIVCLCPNKRRSVEPFVCLDLVSQRFSVILVQIFVPFSMIRTHKMLLISTHTSSVSCAQTESFLVLCPWSQRQCWWSQNEAQEKSDSSHIQINNILLNLWCVWILLQNAGSYPCFRSWGLKNAERGSMK